MPLPPSSNYFTDNEDLRWQLRHTIDWARIVALTENDFTLPDGPESLEEAQEFYFQVLEEVGRFVANEVAPRVDGFDEQGTRLEDGDVVMPDGMQELFAQLGEMGLYGLCAPRELGGMNCPLALYFAVAEVMSRADCGFTAHFGFHGGIAMALLLYADREGSLETDDGRVVDTRFRREIEEIVAGEAWGAMILTEPGAGSDLGAIRARAVRGEDGRWRLTGEKIFITSGHGQHQIVLARTSGVEGNGDGKGGLAGLSLFLVPRWIERDGERVENVKVTKVEKKLGHNTSPTVSLLYDDSEAELIGEEGQGFELMLVLMNNARVAVGFEALGVAEAAYRMATAYAEQRWTMGRPIKDHELVADMLRSMDTDIRGMRALTFEALNSLELSQKLEYALAHRTSADAAQRAAWERELAHHKRYVRELTPLVKYLTSEKAVELARVNMQIHGGMGYIKETGADRLLRDALVLPIYEGTSQIQALMALKDQLGWVMKDPAGFLRKAAKARLDAQVTRGAERAFHQAEVKLYQTLETILGRILGAKVRSELAGALARGSLGERLDYLRRGFLRSWDTKRDFAHGLLHAERLTRMVCDVAVARVLLRQAEVDPARRVYAERWIARMLPRVTALALEVQHGGDLDDLSGAAADPDGEPAAVA